MNCGALRLQQRQNQHLEVASCSSSPVRAYFPRPRRARFPKLCTRAVAGGGSQEDDVSIEQEFEKLLQNADPEKFRRRAAHLDLIWKVSKVRLETSISPAPCLPRPTPPPPPSAAQQTRELWLLSGQRRERMHVVSRHGRYDGGGHPLLRPRRLQTLPRVQGIGRMQVQVLYRDWQAGWVAGIRWLPDVTATFPLLEMRV